MKLLAATALAASIATSALASGPVVTYEPPVVIAPVSTLYDWSGPYLGVGLAYSRSTTSTNAPGVILPDANGASLSGLVGYNWQHNNTVMGVEAALNFSNISGSNTCGFGARFGCTIRVDNFASLRARLGYSVDRTLFFVTAGFATDSRSLFFTNGVGSATFSNRFNGPVVGVGIEQAMNDNWTVRGDLEHYFFGSDAVGPFTTSADTSLLRVSLVRRF